LFLKAALYILRHCIRSIQHFPCLLVLYSCELLFVSRFSKELLVHLFLLSWVLLLYVSSCRNAALPFQLFCELVFALSCCLACFFIHFFMFCQLFLSFCLGGSGKLFRCCSGTLLNSVCTSSHTSLHASLPAALLSLCCMATLWRPFLSLFNTLCLQLLQLVLGLEPLSGPPFENTLGYGQGLLQHILSMTVVGLNSIGPNAHRCQWHSQSLRLTQWLLGCACKFQSAV